MVSNHGCIRVFKESMALMERGYTVDIVANQAPFGYNKFETLSVFHDREQLKRIIAASPADIFHVHNEPDWLVYETREATGKPVVYDIHDLESMRWDAEPDDDENKAFAAADGYVHVSHTCREAAYKYHTPKPDTVLPCYALREYVVENPGDVSVNSIVYAGGLSSAPLTEETPQGTRMNMRNYGAAVEAFTKQGFNFHLISASRLNDLYYENLGGVVSSELVYPVLMRALRPFGFGLVGSVVPTPLMQAAMPNKLFEYLTQGVVPVLLNMDEAGEFVRSRGIGYVLNGLDNLRDQLAGHEQTRKRLLEQRHEFVMESHIDAVIDLYRKVMEEQ